MPGSIKSIQLSLAVARTPAWTRAHHSFPKAAQFGWRRECDCSQKRHWLSLPCLGCLIVAAWDDAPRESTAAVIDVLPTQLNAQPPGANWLSYNGDFTGRRFSSLSQINPANVGQLRAQWVFHSSNSNRLEVTPVVVNGVMFVTSANDTYALDARTGRVIWHHVWPISEGLIDDASGHLSRGVAVWHSRVYRQTDNAHLLCLDARSGNLLWDVAYADWNPNYGATGAPLVVKDKVIVGTSGGDDGVRGFVAAFDATTGKLAWRFWTLPGPGRIRLRELARRYVPARRRHRLDARHL